jgi:hypothetical protein
MIKKTITITVLEDTDELDISETAAVESIIVHIKTLINSLLQNSDSELIDADIIVSKNLLLIDEVEVSVANIQYVKSIID